jgi:ADP-ribosylglycohydrolase
MTSGSVEECIEAALSVIPADSWTARAIQEAVEIGEEADSVEAALQPLYDALVTAYYPWADLGPEAVGLAFGLLAASKGHFEEAVLGGTNIGRDTDTIAAIAGAIIGAQLGLKRLPPRWVERIQVIKGRCIRVVAGIDLLDIADQLAAMSLVEA